LFFVEWVPRYTNVNLEEYPMFFGYVGVMAEGGNVKENLLLKLTIY